MWMVVCGRVADLLGSRTVFSQAFLKDLAEVWSEEVERRWLKQPRQLPSSHNPQ
jgi:hypothetical protein